jgi:acetyl-CoA C-acetyltransferase
MNETLILAGARTPFATWSHGTTGDGSPGGAFKDSDPFDLGAAALTGALTRSGVAPSELGFVAFGNMYQVGAHGCYGARYVTHRAGCPPEVPGAAVNLACGTGLLALKTAAEVVTRGDAAFVAAVGADAPSRLRRDVFVPSFVDLSCGKHIAKTAEERAREGGLTRADADAYAEQSHARAAASAAKLAEEIVPFAGRVSDDAVRRAPAADFFSASRALFDDGSDMMTHANVHGIVDGGSALILAAPKAARGRALGRLVSTALVGTPPERMAYAAVPAARLALERARWSARDVDVWEINETFAVQVLLDAFELRIPSESLNPSGGAISLGHPFGATGIRLVLTALHELRRRGRRRALAAISVGGGLGIAACVEAV